MNPAISKGSHDSGYMAWRKCRVVKYRCMHCTLKVPIYTVSVYLIMIMIMIMIMITENTVTN